MERDLVETKEKEEQLKVEYKKVESHAAEVMAEHEKLQVGVCLSVRCGKINMSACPKMIVAESKTC